MRSPRAGGPGAGPARGAGPGRDAGRRVRDPGRQDRPLDRCREEPSASTARSSTCGTPARPRPRRKHPGRARPGGFPLWVSEWGRARCTTSPPPAPRPARPVPVALGVPTLADPGYEGAGSASTPPPATTRRPRTRHQHPHPQRLLRSLRARRTRVRPAQGPLAHPPAHHRQPRQDPPIARAALVLTHFEHGYLR